MDSDSEQELRQLVSTRDINQFRADCPLAESLDGDASQ